MCDSLAWCAILDLNFISFRHFQYLVLLHSTFCFSLLISFLSALILFLRSHLSSLLLFLCFLVICSYIFLCKTDCFSDCINYHFINNHWICFYFHIRSINLSLLCHILIHEIKKVLDPWNKNYDKARKYVKRQRHHFVDRGLL